MSAALSVLKSTFGYDAFRAPQAEIIDTLINGGDALVLMPTGGGKSLCYQVPALCRPGVAVVVSPLIALMQDQVQALLQLGVRAAVLNSTLSSAQAREVERQMLNDELDLVYIAPERLTQDYTLDLLDRMHVALFAIDEAHCVSQWGHDFRVDYLQLSLLHQRYPDVPRIALTATADERTRKEIIQRLDLTSARQYVSGFDRPNIRYRIAEKDRARQQLLRFLQREHPGDAGIVYCLSRRKVEETATWLSDQGFTALPYHAGMLAEQRRLNQERFLKEEGIIIVATIAFGMGIDKPDVRFVAHLDLPKSIEAYYQETGRAGRDGLAADAWMVYGFQDVIKLRQMLAGSEGSEAFKKIERYKLDAMLGFCELTTCRRHALLHYLGEESAEQCGNCDNCLEPVKTWDGTEAAQKALSCVYRTGQRFGVNHLIDVLLGNDNEKVRQFGHHQVSTYGIGGDYDTRQWRSVFRQLVARAYLNVDVEGFGGLRLTEKSRALLRGEEILYLRVDRASDGNGGGKAKRIRESDKYNLSNEEELLWDRLRERRKVLAETQGVPPYVIFHDATLMELVRYQPVQLDQFAKINGVGGAKLDRYGREFIEVISRFRDEFGMSPVTQTGITMGNEGFNEQQHSDTEIESVNLARGGMNLFQIAERRKLQPDTIAKHLGATLETGALAIESVCALESHEVEQIYNQLAAAMDENETLRLKPVYEFFAGAYSYPVLRCVRSAFLSGKVKVDIGEPSE